MTANCKYNQAQNHQSNLSGSMETCWESRQQSRNARLLWTHMKPQSLEPPTKHMQATQEGHRCFPVKRNSQCADCSDHFPKHLRAYSGGWSQEIQRKIVNYFLTIFCEKTQIIKAIKGRIRLISHEGKN